MICESCQESTATVHLTETGKGIPKKETHLCEPCAGEQGVPYYGEFSVKDYLGGLAKAREAGVQHQEPTMNKIDQAFDAAWASIGAAAKTTKFVNPEKLVKLAFVAGARAFSTMPLCTHGVAIWGVEHCPDCEDAPGEFPGYNLPFELPEGQAGASVDFLLMADLKAEHESMRLSLVHALTKAGVIDQNSLAARHWDPITLIRFTGLWITDAMPWVSQGKTHQELELTIRRLERHAAYTDQRIKKLEEGDHEARVVAATKETIERRAERVEEAGEDS